MRVWCKNQQRITPSYSLFLFLKLPPPSSAGDYWYYTYLNIALLGPACNAMWFWHRAPSRAQAEMAMKGRRSSESSAVLSKRRPLEITSDLRKDGNDDYYTISGYKELFRLLEKSRNLQKLLTLSYLWCDFALGLTNTLVFFSGVDVLVSGRTKSKGHEMAMDQKDYGKSQCQKEKIVFSKKTRKQPTKITGSLYFCWKSTQWKSSEADGRLRVRSQRRSKENLRGCGVSSQDVFMLKWFSRDFLTVF